MTISYVCADARGTMRHTCRGFVYTETATLTCECDCHKVSAA